MEKNLDIDRIVVNNAFMKNHKDGNVNANIYFIIANTMFIIALFYHFFLDLRIFQINISLIFI